MTNEVSEGRIVKFYPSERTSKKFDKQKQSYPAIVTEVNENSVDLTVFGVGQEVHVTRVTHKDQTEEGRSFWDWPQR